MIQEIKIKNFLSFRDEVELSFEATKDTTFEEYQVVEVAPKVRLLRFAMLYGANASGKSNVLKAFHFLENFWFAAPQNATETTGVVPFLLDKETPSQPSEFNLKFWVDGTKYWYQLALDRQKVLEEKLYYYKSAQPTALFTRIFEDGHSVIKPNPAAVKVGQRALEELNVKCLPNMSFFAARDMVNLSLPPIDTARDWLRSCMLPYVGPQTDLFDFAGRNLLQDSPLHEYLLDFVRHADFNISDITSDQIDRRLPEEMVKALLNNDLLDLSDNEREKLRTSGTVSDLRTMFQHEVTNSRGKESYLLPKSLQSDGTRRTIGMEAAIYTAITGNAFLCVDEMDASLHPDLMEYIIEKFLKAPVHSQMLITTHYDPLLNTVNDLIRKDSVWFTEKDEAGNSSLYSLTDFSGLGKLSSIQRSYRNGLFGALPNIK